LLHPVIQLEKGRMPTLYEILSGSIGRGKFIPFAWVMIFEQSVSVRVEHNIAECL
jgi:hypothetical protein